MSKVTMIKVLVRIKLKQKNCQSLKAKKSK